MHRMLKTIVGTLHRFAQTLRGFVETLHCNVSTALLWLILCCFYAPAFAGLADGLVAYYPFERTANDLSGNENHGAENGGLVYVNGIKGQAVKLDGVDDWIQVNNSNSFPTAEISLSYWLKQDNLPINLSNYISKELSFQSYLLDNGTFHSGLWKGSAGQWSAYLSGSYKYNVNRWVMYTWTFSNATKKSKTFIDGKLVAEETENDANAYLRTSSEPMYIGRNGSQNVYHVNGLIDELRIYNRTLTPTEITELYQQGTPPIDPNDELGGFIDLNKSVIDTKLNKVAITFTKPITTLCNVGSSCPILSNYFNEVGLRIGDVRTGDSIKKWTLNDISQLIDSNNSVIFDMPDLSKYPNQLVQLEFMKIENQQLISSSSMLGVTDKVVTFAPNAIVSSRQLFGTKPKNTIECTDVHGIKSKCNNFLDTAETSQPNNYLYGGAVFRNIFTHRLVDFDKVVGTSINPAWEKSLYGLKAALGVHGDNGRIPLLLIHGWQGDKWLRSPAKLGLWENSELHYFQHFLDYYLTSAALQKKYHIYLYHYPSYKHVAYNAFILNKMLDEVGQNLPETDLGRAIATTEAYKDSPNNKLTIVAHSMGGLLARSLIEEYGGLNKPTVSDGFMGKLNQLITLDTPHHGSTGSDPSKLLNSVAKDLTTQGAVDLNWDNYDDRISSGEIATINTKYRWLPAKTNSKSFDTAFCGGAIQCNVTSMNPWLLNLNQQFEQNHTQLAKDKYLLYVAWMSDYKKGALALVKNIDNISNGLDYDFAEAVGIPDLPNGVAAPITSALLSKSSGDMTYPFNPQSKQHIPAFYSPEIFQDSDAYFWYAFKESLLPKIGPPDGELFLSEYDLFDSTQSASITRNTQLHSILISKENILNYYEHPYGLPYRIFWDYDHEKMVNGAYLGDIGGWDKFISQNPTVDVATKASAFYFNSSRNNYISAAFSYNGKPFKIDNTQVYNPLKNEPLYLVLERDLLLPKLVVSDTAIDYGNVTDVTPLAHDVTLTNQGIGDLQLNKTNYALTGRDAVLFKVTPACPTILATAQTCGFTVTFTPPAKPWLTGYFGIKTATLTIKSNDRDSPALKIALKARLKDTGAALAIGKTYQGGIIFYLDDTGQHGLIAAPTDQGIGLAWGFYSTTGATGIAIGTGKANTTTIVTKLGDGWAAALCDNLVLNGYNDWFLPSRNELALLYTNKEIIGGFASSIYWSSSEDDFTDAWAQNFVSGIQSFGNKHNKFRIRAVRAF